jgi:hypothetical protein
MHLEKMGSSILELSFVKHERDCGEQRSLELGKLVIGLGGEGGAELLSLL